MRKKLFIPLLLAAGVLSIGSISVLSRYEKVSADVPDYQTYVPLRDGWIENTDGSAATNLNDAIRARNDRFWTGAAEGWDSQERSFNALDEFVDTIHRANGGEGWRGAYRTPELTLHDNDHRYISFLFGGGETDIFINVWHVRHANGSEEFDGGYNRNVIEGVRPFFDNSGNFDDRNNSPRTCNMTFRYYRLPDSIEVGDKYLIYVRDGKTEGYGGFTFGDVHINQTLEDCARSFSAHKTQMKLNEYMSDWTRNANENVLTLYATDNYYADVRTAEAALTDANDDFEVNNRLSKWAYDQQNSTYEDGALANINYDSIYSDKEIKWGGYFRNEVDGLMPTNKSGNKFLTGEPNNVDGNNCGLPESAKYRLVSPEFTLSGTGLISAKLGGHYTALQLLDSNLNVLLSTGNTNPSFVDASVTNIAQSGARLNTMVRTYLDCGAYIGQRVHVALLDTQTGGGWNLAYFDEIVTKYNSNPGLRIDHFTQASALDEENVKWNGYILDKYLDHNHNADFKAAYDFLQTYYSTLRTPANKFDYAYAEADDKADIGLAYSALSAEAKAIVDASDDLETVEKDNNFNADWWFNHFVNPANHVSVSVPDELSIVVRTVSFDANGGSGEITPVKKLDGKTYSLPECTFTAPLGYEFAGWKVNDSGETLAVDDEITVEADISLVAQWSIKKFSVTYNANGGSGDNHVVNDVEYGTEYELLALGDTAITAPAGKRFVEWNTSADGNGTAKAPAETYSITEGVTFYAIWEDNARTQIEALPTKTVLGYDYTGDAENGFEFSNLRIRFRGALDASLWAQLNSEETIQGYGVMVSLGTSTEEYLGDRHFETEYATKLEAASGNVDAAISALCDGTKIKNFYNDNSVESPFSNGVKCSWSLAQEVKYSVPENKVHVLTRQYVAVAYIRTNSGLVFFDETRVSVKDIATQMIASDQYDDSSMGGSLHHLAHLGE